MKKILIFIITLFIITVCVIYSYNSYIVSGLKKLGYDEEEISLIKKKNKIISINGYEITLQEKIENTIDEIKNEIGLEAEFNSDAKLVLIEKELTQKLKELHKEFDAKIAKIDEEFELYNFETIPYDETISKNSHIEILEKQLSENKQALESKVAALEKELLNIGAREEVLDDIRSDNLITHIENLEKKIVYYDNYFGSIPTKKMNFASGREKMLAGLNDYRKSLGLPLLSYNYDKQSCIDKEALAYANNRNPHNWVCDVDNEGSSLAPITSDYVQIALNFYTTHGSHRETVITPSYRSIAVSLVEYNGMVYMVVGYWR